MYINRVAYLKVEEKKNNKSGAEIIFNIELYLLKQEKKY